MNSTLEPSPVKQVISERQFNNMTHLNALCHVILHPSVKECRCAAEHKVSSLPPFSTNWTHTSTSAWTPLSQPILLNDKVRNIGERADSQVCYFRGGHAQLG